MRALGELGMDALPALAEAVKGEDLNASVAALVRLRGLGAEAIPALIAALANPGIAALAAGALGNLGAEARAAVPDLKKRLEASTPSFAVATALLQIDPTTGDLVIPKVLETFKRADKTARDTHLRRLIQILGRDLAPYLESARESENGPLRRAAQRGLELREESTAGR